MNCKQIEKEIRVLVEASNCTVEEAMQKAYPILMRLREEEDNWDLVTLLNNSDSLAQANEGAEMILHGLYSDAEV